jgi:hypothetical protein
MPIAVTGKLCKQKDPYKLKLTERDDVVGWHQ